MRKGLWIVVAVALALAGCSKTEETAKNKPAEETKVDLAKAIVGKFEGSMDTSGVAEKDRVEVEAAAKQANAIQIEIREGGTAMLLARGDNLTAKWKLDGDKLTITPDKDTEDEGVLTVTEGGDILLPDPSMGMGDFKGAKMMFKKVGS